MKGRAQRLGASSFLKAMDHAGDYIELVGYLPRAVAQTQSDVYDEVLSQYPQLKRLDSKVANWRQADAKAIVSDLLVRYPTIKGILCENDWMALGAAEALREAGQRKIVVGFDGIPEVLNAVREGTITATVELPGRQLGERAIEQADQLIKTKRPPRASKQLIECKLYPPTGPAKSRK